MVTRHTNADGEAASDVAVDAGEFDDEGVHRYGCTDCPCEDFKDQGDEPFVDGGLTIHDREWATEHWHDDLDPSITLTARGVLGEHFAGVAAWSDVLPSKWSVVQEVDRIVVDLAAAGFVFAPKSLAADIKAVLTVYDEHVAPENRGEWRDNCMAWAEANGG